MKLIIICLILFLQIRIIYGFFMNFEYGNKEDIKTELINYIKNKDLFLNLENKVLNELPKTKLCLENLLECHKFDKKENLKFFENKNLLFIHMNIIQKKLIKFKKHFKTIKNLKLIGVDKLMKFDDLKNFFNIIKNFLKKNEKITKFYRKTHLSSLNTVILQSKYKKYIDEIKLNEFFEKINKNLNILYFYFNLKEEILEKLNVSIKNKIEILREMNKSENSFEYYTNKNVKYNYKKLYYNDSVKNIMEINFDIENIVITLDHNIILRYNQLIDILYKLKDEVNSIDNLKNKEKYKSICLKFLDSLNSFFISFEVKLKSKESNLNKDYGHLCFLKLIEKLLLNSKNNYKSNFKLVYEIILGDMVSFEEVVNQTKEKAISKLYTIEWFKEFIYIMKSIDYICIENKKIFSKKNESNVQEFLNEELNDMLEKYNNLITIIVNYLNIEDFEKKKMENIILKKLIFYFDSENNEKNNLKESNINYFLNYLHENYNFNYSSSHNLKKYEFIVLFIIFNKLKNITNYIYEQKNFIIAELIEYKDVPSYIKNIFNILNNKF